MLGHLQQQLTTRVYAGFDKNDSSEEEYDNHIVLGHTSLASAEPGSWCWRLARASHMITTTSYLTLRTKDGSDNCAFSESFPFHFTQSVTPSIKP